MTRCCDGHIRETWLRCLLGHEVTEWELPYVIMSLGDYAIQVNQIAAEYIINISANSTSFLPVLEFSKRNHCLMILLESRCVSYWNEYYRQPSIGRVFFPYMNDYPPLQAIRVIKELALL
jgi:hypothetical protein